MYSSDIEHISARIIILSVLMEVKLFIVNVFSVEITVQVCSNCHIDTCSVQFKSAQLNPIIILFYTDFVCLLVG